MNLSMFICLQQISKKKYGKISTNVLNVVAESKALSYF